MYRPGLRSGYHGYSGNPNQTEKWKIMIGYIKDGKISVCLTQDVTCGSTELTVDVPQMVIITSLLPIYPLM